jgi:hypothetical protein
MALKATAKDKLKTTFNIDVDKLIAAITATDEQDFEIPADVTVIKNDDLTTRDNNNKLAGKTEGITEGEKKGKELAAKALKRKLSIADTVPNEIDKVIEAANEQLGKGDAGLREQITLLQNDKTKLEQEKTELSAKAKAAAFDAELISYFPTNRSGDLTDSERLALVKMNLEFVDENGKTVVKRNGEIQRDKANQNPLAVKDVISTLFTDKKWVGEGAPGSGGRGGGDNPPAGGGAAGVKTMTGFKQKWVAENPGKDENGPEFQDAVAKHTKDIPDFNWYG